MSFSFAGWMDLTRHLIQAPRATLQQVLRMGVSPEMSIQVIALSAVISGIMAGILGLLTGVDAVAMEMANGETVQLKRGGPIIQAIAAFVVPMLFVWALGLVGRRMGGQGGRADVLSVMAALQIGLVPVLVAQSLAAVLFPLIAVLLLLFSLYVYLRGLLHAVDVAHGFDNMGKSGLVVVLSFVAMVVAMMLLMVFLGPLLMSGAIQ